MNLGLQQNLSSESKEAQRILTCFLHNDNSTRIVPNFSLVGMPDRILVEDSSVGDSAPADGELEGPALVSIFDAMVGTVFQIAEII